MFLAKAPQSEAIILNVDMWWPQEAVHLSGVQPFKGMLSNMPVNDYDMWWSVDDGGRVKMETDYADYPHKEASVDLTNWNWKGAGPYTLTFTATNANGVLGTKKMNIYVDSATKPAATALSAPANLLSSMTLYKNPATPALTQALSWKTSRPADAAVMEKIGSQSTALWLTGGSYDTNTISEAYKKAGSSVPTFVLYNIPQRDCGSYSAGGTNNATAYRAWISNIKNAVGTNKAIFIVEPDALPGADCLSSTDQETRFSLIKEAVSTLKQNSNAFVYIDAGHAFWKTPDVIAPRLQKAGIASANGFSLNVSNFNKTEDTTRYGEEVSKLVNDKHFVIDTSRNGNGSNGEWCNPSGRALGKAPTTNTGNTLIDAYLWIKVPGESDGNCNGGPNAGSWWPEYALTLGKNAGY